MRLKPAELRIVRSYAIKARTLGDFLGEIFIGFPLRSRAEGFQVFWISRLSSASTAIPS